MKKPINYKLLVKSKVMKPYIQEHKYKLNLWNPLTYIFLIKEIYYEVKWIKNHIFDLETKLNADIKEGE